MIARPVGYDVPRGTDFALLRLALATSVIFAHFSAIFRAPTGVGLSAVVPVQAFFVVSGWVVGASFAGSASISAFWVRRAARLYPLYAALVVCQAMACALITVPPNARRELVQYLAYNLAFANFLKPTLFGFFADAPVKAINPSLWTLKVEVAYYITVPLIIWSMRRFGRSVIVLLFLASTAFAYHFPATTSEAGRQFPGQLRFFLVGIGCWGAQAHIPRLEARYRPLLLAALGAIGFIAAHRLEKVVALTALQPFWVGLFVLGAANVLPRLGRIPDISYGVYLLHAPIAQFGRYLGLIDSTRWGLVQLLVLTFAAALAGCLLIELPAIALGRRVSASLSAARGTKFFRSAAAHTHRS